MPVLERVKHQSPRSARLLKAKLHCWRASAATASARRVRLGLAAVAGCHGLEDLAEEAALGTEVRRPGRLGGDEMREEPEPQDSEPVAE